MPGTVSEGSATLVASTMRRPRLWANTLCCCSIESRANSGSTSSEAAWRRRARLAEMRGKTLCIERCRGDDDAQIGTLRQKLLQVPEQEVDVEAALVRLVDDEGVVRGKPAIGLRFREQDTVGHQLDVRVVVKGAKRLTNLPSPSGRGEGMRDAVIAIDCFRLRKSLAMTARP